MSKKKKCDFCSQHKDNPPVASYGCKDFFHRMEPTDPGMGFLNNWLACQHCDKIIQEDNLRGLIDRAVTTYIETHGTLLEGMFRPKDQIKQQVTQLHVKFWSHRTGERNEVKINEKGGDKNA